MKKILYRILSVLMIASIVVFPSGLRASADTIAMTANDGRTTDFIESWAGMGVMGAYINENGETVIGADSPMSYGHRLQNIDRVDLYSQQINFTMDVPDGALGFYALVQAEYINQGSSLAFVINRTEAGKTGLIIGQSHEATGDAIIKTMELADQSEHTFDIKFSKADDGVALDLTVDGNYEVINISENILLACLGTSNGALNTSLNQIYGGWNGIISATVHSYTDANRAAYLDQIKGEFDGFVAELDTALVNVKALNADTPVEQLVAERKSAVSIQSAVSNSSFRNYEKTFVNNKVQAIFDALANLAGDNQDLVDLMTIASYIELFSEKAVPEGLATKEEAQFVENIKSAIDYDKLLDLEDSDQYADYVSTMGTKYAAARDILNQAKDALVLKDIEAFENAVADLSSDEKIQAAGDAKNIIVLSNALIANQDSYSARVSTAAGVLSKAMKSYAGDLAKYWDIYNVTFAKANDANEIEFAATDYYNDDPSSDVGISFRDKLKLDGLSVEFTYTAGNIGPNVWLGLHFFSELDVMHISDTDNYKGSAGITTLIVPKDGSTEFQMGYPKLYGNAPESGWPAVPVSTMGTKFKVEFKKNADVYDVYATAGDAEPVLLRTMDAEVLETNLPGGEGYLNIGYCDKDLSTGKITIHTINGQAAATLVAENVYVDQEEAAEVTEVAEEPAPTKAPVVEPVTEKKSNTPIILVVTLIAVALVAGCIVLVMKKNKKNK